MSPNVFRSGPYRVFFYSNEGSEPAHVHVRAGSSEAKYWLDPIELEWNYGFRSHQRKAIERILQLHLEEIQEAWDVHAQRKL